MIQISVGMKSFVNSSTHKFHMVTGNWFEYFRLSQIFEIHFQKNYSDQHWYEIHYHLSILHTNFIRWLVNGLKISDCHHMNLSPSEKNIHFHINMNMSPYGMSLRWAEKLKFSKFFPGVSKSGYFTQTNYFCFLNVPLKMTPSHPFLAVCVWHYKPLLNRNKINTCTNKNLQIDKNLLPS